jgi:FkbM family methyltransferase
MLRKVVRSISKLFTPRFLSQHEIEKAEQVFYIEYLKPGMVVFDVGANVGELSLLFSRFVSSTGKVYAFECSPDTFERLQKIVDLSRRMNIKSNCLCLSDHAGTARLHTYDKDHATWNTLADRPLHKYGIDIEPVSVTNIETATVDEYCRINNIQRIDLLKIDVEGAEYQVIKGASRMMREKRIGCVVFEFGQTTFDMGNDPSEFSKLIAGFDYKLRNIVKGYPVFPGGESATTAQFSMHVCTPR